MTTSPAPNPFALQIPGDWPIGGIGRRLLSAAGQWLLALPEINRTYQRAVEKRSADGFVERVLADLNVDCRVTDQELSRIPAGGPLIVVANHPFGGIDGLILAALLRRVRPDVKLLANRLLGAAPELHDTFLFVDAFGGEDAPARNLPAMRSAVAWLRRGGALGVFPAGEVSHLRFGSSAVEDGPWGEEIGRLASLTRAAVVPVYFEGRNSALFQVSGLIHPLLRTILLPRELLRQRNRTIAARIGSVVPPQRLAAFTTDRQRADYLRVRTEVLRARADLRARRRAATDSHEPIAAPQPVEQLEAELNQLHGDQRLASSGHFTVYYGQASQLPCILREIGRLREITFREVGEGSGRSSDLDRFDQTYLHLFVWNHQRRELVGAYRLGLTDQILPHSGPDGLYTSTLFRYDRRLLHELDPAIELGRSFVRPEHQREFVPLMLLWKGIGLFVARYPRYRRMFGPVSISNDYASLSKQLLIAFLTINNSLPILSRLVTPRHPPRFGPGRRCETMLAATAARSIDEVDALVTDIETDGRGVPVLLRQYLKLGAKLLGFNIDPDFGHVLDGLMLIDLLDVQPAVLNRYMGRENARSFVEHHARSSQSEIPLTRGER